MWFALWHTLADAAARDVAGGRLRNHESKLLDQVFELDVPAADAESQLVVEQLDDDLLIAGLVIDSLRAKLVDAGLEALNDHVELRVLSQFRTEAAVDLVHAHDLLCLGFLRDLAENLVNLTFELLDARPELRIDEECVVLLDKPSAAFLEQF